MSLNPTFDSIAGPRPRRRAGALLALLLAVPLGCGCEIVEAPEDEPEPQVVDDGDGGRGPDLVVVDGIDHALPDWVEPEEFGGYVDHPEYAEPSGVGVAHRNWWTSWAELEPERGQYAWDVIENRLAAAEAGGYRLCMHVLGVVCGGGNAERDVVVQPTVPDWVFTEFGLDDGDVVCIGGDWQIEVIPVWRPDIAAAFEAMIRALGERGYPQREALGSAYVHGISSSRGEEFWPAPWQADLLESRAGFGPDVMQDWIAGRLDAYADAFGPDVRKVAWVGMVEEWKYCGQDYGDAAWNLVQHAWDVGAGNRASIVEMYHISLDEPALGQSIDADGYLHTDETIPPIADGRYFGDENEEYGPRWNWRYGGTDGDWQRYRFAMLRALQMQMRFLWTGAEAEALDPALSHYARHAFGKTVANSPDAWCYLKESAVSTAETPAGVVRNFERWLRQRDVPGGVTVPAERVDRAFNAGSILDGAEGAFYDHTARRTDLEHDQRCIYFDLDDRFDAGGPVRIKVEVVDAAVTSWRIEYTGAGGDLATTDAYDGPGDGAVRTVTFTIDDARFAGDLPGGMDFRIVCDGPGDVVARWVRLVRTTRP